MQWALIILFSALIAAFLGLEAVRTIVIVGDAVHHAINTPTPVLRGGHPDESRLP
jgi:hypothetical protein